MRNLITRIKEYKYTAVIFFTLFFLYDEFLFRLAVVKSLGGNFFVHIITMMLFLGIAFSLLWGLFNRGRLRSWIFGFVVIFVTIFYLVHLIYYSVFNTYWAPFSMMGLAGQAFDFMDMIIDNILRQIVWVILYILPVIFYFLFVKGSEKQEFEKDHIIVRAGLGVLMLGIFFTAVNSSSRDKGSTYDSFYNAGDIDSKMTHFGPMVATILDGVNGNKVGSLIVESDAPIPGDDTAESNDENGGSGSGSEGETEKESGGSSGSKVKKYGKNILENVDVTSVVEATGNSGLIDLNSYFMSQEASKKNEYTGLFKGYNVIYVTAEGFSKWAVDEERTPTLYKMIHSGFEFTHYYTPLYYGSTSAGEWVDLTGYVPNPGGSPSMVLSGEMGTNLYFCPGKVFGRLGYATYGFHNNSYTYYERNLSHPNMGYTWIGTGSGYEPETNGAGNDIWPQSDSHMVDVTFDMYADQQPFHAYYMTVSGHAGYSFAGNSMASRHYDIVENLPYSDEAKAYIACQYELELFLQNIERRLEEKGIADKTVIVLSADHIPYNNREMCEEIAGHKFDDNVFEWYESYLIIYCPGFKEHVVVDKYCSSIDILPTVLNLFGVDFDSRMISGKDILSDAEGVVAITYPGSFITDRCFYNADTGVCTPIKEGDTISDEYIKQQRTKVTNMFQIANMVITYNYFDYYEKAVNQAKPARTEESDSETEEGSGEGGEDETEE
ncbi:MAG: sulfatase-like hydrolase/transferase [Lachnospiraceae bacterium]|nr:sulfatase-like hydrolase/transferase [Lachnospiraceae bacterium]